MQHHAALKVLGPLLLYLHLEGEVHLSHIGGLARHVDVPDRLVALDRLHRLVAVFKDLRSVVGLRSGLTAPGDDEGGGEQRRYQREHYLSHCWTSFVRPDSSRVTGSTLCLLYTSDAADDLLCVDLGGRR